MHTAPRFRAPKLRDPRVLIAVLILVASVVATWLVVTSAAKTTTVWAAAEPLSPGTVITRENIRPVEVRLPDDSSGYRRAADDDLIGQTVLSPIAAGDLVPASQVGSGDSLGGRRVSLPLQRSLPADVKAGSRIDVWAVDMREDRGDPEPVLRNAAVLSVDRDGGGFTVSSGVSVEVFVPNDSLQKVLRSVAAEDHLSVVSIPKERP